MLEEGSTIGGLVIGELLGRGAMGEVYRAEQISLRRPVAVKRIAEHLIDDESVVGRFEREAQCIARVNSPNVLGVYEFGKFSDQSGAEHWLLVMELVEGGCNARELMREGLDWRQATSIIMQVAEGLAVAAEHGIVHRDIKPDNIMVNSKGVAKLADFGLAKAADSNGMTMEGALLGTPYYMPPEACQGDPIGPAGDLYSLGASWYHFLHGRPVFEHKNTMMILRAHAEEEPAPLSTVAPDVPEPIAALVHQCLRKKASDRPHSAEHLAHLIQSLVADGITIPRTIPDVMQEAETILPTSASTLKTSLAYSVSGEATTPALDQGKSTLAAEISLDAKGSKKPLVLVSLVALVLIAAAAGLVGLGMLNQESDQGLDQGQGDQVDVQQLLDTDESATSIVTGADEKGNNAELIDPASAQLVDETFALVQRALDRDDPVSASTALQQVADLAQTNETWSTSFAQLSESIVTMARAKSSGSLQQSMQLMQAGKLSEAIAILERDSVLADIAGIGDRYKQVMATLRKQQQ